MTAHNAILDHDFRNLLNSIATSAESRPTYHGNSLNGNNLTGTLPNAPVAADDLMFDFQKTAKCVTQLWAFNSRIFPADLVGQDRHVVPPDDIVTVDQQW